MSDEKVATELTRIRKSLNQLHTDLQAIKRKRKGIADWISLYFAYIRAIPATFSDEEWKESEKILYEDLVAQVKGDFAARGMLQSGLKEKWLQILERKRQKVLQARKKSKQE